MTVRLFAAPDRYIQGAGALAQLAPLLAGYGKRPFILADGTTGEALREEIERGLRATTDRVAFALCTEPGLDRFVDSARTLEADLLVGLGGEAAIETAKRMRHALGLPLVIVPTAPSCHAAVSRLVMPEPEGEVVQLARGAEAVLVDTTVFAGTSPRHFIAGIGDALSRKFEVEHCRTARMRTPLGGLASELAMAAADACYAILREHAIAALATIVRRQTGEALERVVEAMVLLSGIAYESGGVSIAHALARGLAQVPACRIALHGERVAFALLAQLVYEERPADLLADLVGFYRALGLPARLAEIGLVGDVESVVDGVARRSCAGLLVPVDGKRLAVAILAADALVRP